MKKIAVVILHYGGKKLTRNCLKSLEKVKKKDFSVQVIVVNNSPQESLRSLKEEFDQFIFLKTTKNLGFAGGNNLGLKRALEWGAEAVLVLNNDTVVDENLLVQLNESAEKNEEVGILGPKIYFAPGYEYHLARYKANEQGKVFWFAGGLIDWRNVLVSHRGVDEVDQGQYDQRKETDFISGCAMLIKREVLEKVGLFDERYFLYLEDADFCLRAKQAGFKIAFCPQAKLWHLNASSSSVGGPLHDYFLTRNRLLFGFQYASWRVKLALVRESVKILLTGRQWQKKGARDFYLKKFKQGSWQ